MRTPGNFGRLVAASAGSNLADGALQTVMPLVALSVTRDPGAFAAVTLVGRLPWLFVALPAGALADRLDRRSTMVRVNLARVAILAALTAVVAADRQELWMLYVTAFALGVGETLFDTAAQSILPTVVTDHGRLERANSRLYAVELTANQFVGPAVGGLALAAGVGASTVAYLFGAVVLVTLTGNFRAAAPAVSSIRRDIVDGVRYLAGHRLLRALACCVGISNLASTATFAVFPLYAVRPGPMGLDGAGFGLLLASVAAGSVAGSFLVEPMTRRLGPRGALILAMGASPGFFVAPALTAEPLWVAASFIVAAAVSVSWNIITVSLRQRIVPNHLLGRVNAGYRLLAWGTMPLGAAVGAVVADRAGLTAVFWTSAVLSLLCLPIIWTQVTAAQLSAARAGDVAGDPTPTPVGT